jgi:hypothetical protein
MIEEIQENKEFSPYPKCNHEDQILRRKILINFLIKVRRAL